MIQKLSAGLLLNTELTVVANRLVEAAVRALPSETMIQKMAEVIRSDIRQVEAALGRVHSSDFTAQVAIQDKIRDDAFVALRDFAKANSSRSKPKIAAAGALIYGIFETRGLTLYRFGYAQQSAAMNLLIEDLSTQEAIQALATINAASWFDDLIVAQEEFEQVVSHKSEFEAQQDVPPVRTSRAALIEAVEALLGCVATLHRCEEDDVEPTNLSTLDDLIGTLNEITCDAMAIARARRTRGESAASQEAAVAVAPTGA